MTGLRVCRLIMTPNRHRRALLFVDLRWLVFVCMIMTGIRICRLMMTGIRVCRLIMTGIGVCRLIRTQNSHRRALVFIDL